MKRRADSSGDATRNLLVAEKRAGVKHHILLSIVGIERIDANAHYAGKRMQEELIEASGIPYTIQRATQFHEFAEMVVGWTRKGDVAEIPPILVQPVAAADVGHVLAEIWLIWRGERLLPAANPSACSPVGEAVSTGLRRREISSSPALEPGLPRPHSMNGLRH